MDQLTAFPKSRFLDISWESKTLIFSFTRCFEVSLGLSLRRREAFRNAKSALKAIGSVKRLTAGLVLVVDDRTTTTSDVSSALDEVDRRLKRIAERPLSARMVEQALRITPQERSRWTRDGRLARAGIDLIRRGQTVALSTYAVHKIARLMREPETIQAWREADQGGREPEREA